MDHRDYALLLSALDIWTIASHPELPVNYNYTPKNASSSIMASFLGVSDHPHEAFVNRFTKCPIDVEKPFFCVSRNPFDRILSAYLDKIGPGRDPNVWIPFCRRYGLDSDAALPFRDFLQCLRGDSTPHLLDFHFRPQYFTNNCRFLMPRFTFRFERMFEVEEFLQSLGVRPMRFAPHAQNASRRTRELSADEISIIRDLYRLDFETYGYDMDHRSDFIPDSVVQVQSVSAELEEISGLRGTVDDGELRAHALDLASRGYVKLARHVWHKILMLNHHVLNDVLAFEDQHSPSEDQAHFNIDAAALTRVLAH